MSTIEERLLAAQRDKQDQTIAQAVERSRAAAGQGGQPDAAWSMGEKLLNALVFERADQLRELDYTEAEAIDRLRYDFGATTAEFPGVLEHIRGQLTQG